MGIKNFIPQLSAKKIFKDLDTKHVLLKNCTSEYTGEITNKGSSIVISSIMSPTISDFDEDTGLAVPQTLSDESRTLYITESKSFNFTNGIISSVQSAKGDALLAEGLRKATIGFKNQAEQFVSGKYVDAGHQFVEDTLHSGNVYEYIMKGLIVLRENNVVDMDNVVLELPPALFYKLKLANIEGTTSSDAIESDGLFYRELGVQVFSSNNLPVDEDGYSHAMLRTKDAVAYVEQILMIQDYKPQGGFSKALKGLFVYGAKVLAPKQFVDLKFKTVAELVV